ncbi:glycosyltransferase family 2 protein [Mucilaginibacter lutimaris]|uniref:Glycosyltransferase family 2 protein n=1 Tax=Mucilaginibacter lutimaris TaxID=931629 RepID=A0ABW2Z9D4_9SPHI
MAHRNFTIALLISTYNWPDALELVFLSVLRQTEMPDEILIADDGSREETRELIDSYREKFNIPVKHAWHEDKGFRKSEVLNMAVKLAEADYIIEIDGDIILDRRFIADHVKQAAKGFFVQGSRAMINEPKTNELLKNKDVNLNPLSKGLYTRFNSYRIPSLAKFYDTKPLDPFNVKGCNLAFWRKDYIKVNGYYNDFEGWGWEDYEFAARLINSGVYKKRVKMVAIMYHLFHKQTSRSSYFSNEVIYRRTVAEKLTYCDSGYAEV